MPFLPPNQQRQSTEGKTETMTEVVNCSPPTLWFKGYFQGAVELSSSALYWSNWYKITVWQHTLCDSNKGNHLFNKKPREKKSIHFYQFSLSGTN